MKNCQNTDLNNQYVEFWGPLRNQKMAKNEFIHRNNKLSRSRVQRCKFKHKVRKKIKTYKFLTQIWVFGSFFRPLQFSTGPQLSEYVWVVCRNTKGTCLKSVSKTPTFRFFRDSQPLLIRLLHTSSQMANFGHFLAKMGETGFFSKKPMEHFFHC